MGGWLVSCLSASLFSSLVGTLLFFWLKKRPISPEKAVGFGRLPLLLLFLPFPVQTAAKALPEAAVWWMLCIYGGGSLTVFAFFLFSHGREVKKARARPVPAQDREAKMLIAMARRVGVSPPPLYMAEADVPALSAFRLIVPDEKDDTELYACYFCRMLVYRRQNAVFFFYLWRMALLLHWFNPLVWQMAARDEKLAAAACDNMALWLLPDEQKALYRALFPKEEPKRKNRTLFLH